MGGEIIFYGAAIFGGISFLYLLYCVFCISTRPYGLSTLLFSAVVGAWMSWGVQLHNVPVFFFTGFLLGAVVLGFHALLIRGLLSRSSKCKNSLG